MRDKAARQIKKMIMECGGDWWGEHPKYPREEWRQEIAEQNIQSGYWEWCLHREWTD